mmetsp:Transcript_40368/g.97937  ORF Transcript_40368/g.97937 Transcript_40368/m.97937 type:complete len:414 (-) Transcript_40368:3-1244(-)
MKKTSSRHEDCITIFGVLHSKSHVHLELLLKAVADVPRGQHLPSSPCERRLVHAERDGHGGHLHLDGVERPWVLKVDQRIANVELLHPSECYNIPSARGLDRFSPHGIKREQFRHFDFLDGRAGTCRKTDLTVLQQRARPDASDPKPADERVGRDVGDLQLQRPFDICPRLRELLDLLKDGGHVAPHGVRLLARDTVDGGGVHDRKVSLLVRRPKLTEEVEGLVDNVRRPRRGLVDLVDDDEDRQPERERLLEDEPRLRLRPFRRVDEEKHSIHHVEHALHFAAEVRVPRRVDDVHLDPVVLERRVLRQDRDAALALLVVAIHHSLVLANAAGAQRAGGLEHRVDQRGLPVVDVRDDRDVADVLAHLRRDHRGLHADRGGGAQRRGGRDALAPHRVGMRASEEGQGQRGDHLI